MISLEKGQRESLKFSHLIIGLGWDANSYGGVDFDLDASVFIIGDNGKILSPEHFVFYNNLSSPDGAVKHSGDNLTGDGDGDDETITVDLEKMDPRARELRILVTIHEAAERRQNFGQVRNSYIRICDADTGAEMMKYELEEDFCVETAVEFGRIYKHNGGWKFDAIGQGNKAGLRDYLSKYY